MKSRLFLKIFVTYVVLVLTMAAVFDFLLIPQIRQILTRNIEEKMIGHGRIISHMDWQDIHERISGLATSADSRVTVIDAGGRVTADSEKKETPSDSHLNRPEVQEARLKGLGSSVRYSRTLRENMLYVAVSVKSGTRINGYVRLARPLKEVTESIEHVYRYLYLALLIVVLPSLLLAFFFARNIAAPIRRIADFTGKIRSGGSPGALMMDSQDEVGQLARNINFILEEQQEKVRLAREKTGKLEAAFAGMAEGVLVLDGENRAESCNRSLCVMLGKRPEDVLNKTPMEIFHSALLQDALQRFREAGAADLGQEIALGEGQSTLVHVNFKDIPDLPDGQKKTVVVFHDVTRLKHLERMRSDFIANVTHELKTPLTAIIGYVETLQEMKTDDTALRNRFLRIIDGHARRLDRLVNDLLTLSELEQGEKEMPLRPMALAPVMEELLPLISAKTAAKGLLLETDIPSSLPLIEGNRDGLMQILLNIIDNAVKFTSSGQIVLKAFASEDANDVIVQVTDTGSGIPGQDIPRLGERFFRVDRTRSRELGGTGLGLSIVKHLVKAHFGRMEIESTPGQGTTVTLHFRTNNRR